MQSEHFDLNDIQHEATALSLPDNHSEMSGTKRRAQPRLS